MELTIDVLNLICTFIMTVLAFYAARRYLFKETYFGKKAVAEFSNFELKDEDKIDSYEYEGGNKKFPQIVIEKRLFNRKVTYFIEEDGKRMVKIWYIK